MVIKWVVLFVLGLFTISGGKPTHNCDDNEFPCNDGSCVDKYKWCDAVEDCPDDSDEKYCLQKTFSRSNPNRCDESFFLCSNGICIPMKGHCDGFYSCPDNSDEEDCDMTRNSTNVTPLIQASTETEQIVKEFTTFHSETTNHSGISMQEILQADSISNRAGESNDPLNRFIPPENDDKLNAHNPRTANHLKTPNSDAKSNVKVSVVHENQFPNHLKPFHDVAIEREIAKVEHNQTLNRVINLSVNVSKTGTQDTNQTYDSLEDERYDNKALKRPEAVQGEDLTREFVEMNPHDYRMHRINAQKWLLKVRNANYGWGDETARAITVVFMSNDDLMIKQSDKLLMSNQLKLKLFAALMRNETERMSLEELALFINALSASCYSPRNFYGHDLVEIFRYRTNIDQMSSLVSPFVYLVLCLNNVTSYSDVVQLHKIMHDSSRFNQIGIEAMGCLASTCMDRNTKFPSFQLGLPSRLLHKMKTEGLPENIYDLSLLAQALNEAHINQDLWKRSEVMSRIVSSQAPDGSFGDILSTYYAMPALFGRSIVSIDQHCLQQKDESLVPIEVLKNGKEEKHIVTYSLRFGNPPEKIETMELKVKKSANFFDIMRISETLNPGFKFRYVMKKGKPFIYSIGGVINDAEKGLYWSLHVTSGQMRNTTGVDLVEYEDDIRNFYPSSEQFVIFWLKPIF